MPERQLATVETIVEIHPIPDADAIEVAKIRGWNVVVRKDEFAVGDQVVYFEIDSALPLADPRFTFLGERSTKTIPADPQTGAPARDVHVLKTARLRGTYSQGLVISADAFAAEIAAVSKKADADLDADLAGEIGVTKWEPPLPDGMAALAPFPSFLRKTDAERVQNIDAATWEKIQADAQAWSPVEKVDGSSLTAWLDEDRVLHVAGRNWELDPGHDNAHWRAAAAAGLAQLLEPGQYVQAEVAGTGIQSNPLKLDGVRLFVFTLGRLDGTALGALTPHDQWPAWARDLAAPVYDFPLPSTIEETVSQVEKLTSLISPGKGAEGVVWTRRDGQGLAGLEGRHVFKSISARYLLKHS